MMAVQGEGFNTFLTNTSFLWKLKLWLVFPLLYPTQSDATLNCSYTVRGQHQTIWHQDSTVFIWNVHSKTVWTVHWYCIVHWY